MPSRMRYHGVRAEISGRRAPVPSPSARERSEHGRSLRMRLLERLRGGEPVSGEELARLLGVSRAALWKHMQALRRLGYPIEGSPGRGYRLLQVGDLLLPEEVLPRLDARRLGRPYRFFATLDSTNLEARRLALAGAPEGTTVVADYQTRGRGRRGRTWIAPPGSSLCVSVVLRPARPPGEVGRLTLLVAVAARRAIRAITGLSPEIKWPNDLLLGGRKCCGILLELAAQQDALEFVVAGVGINVNQTAADFGPELAATATSLRQELGRPVPRADLLAALLRSLDHVYEAWLAGADGPLLEEWRGACAHLGRPVRVLSAEGSLSGVALDVGDDGALLVLPEGGAAPVRVLAGDVSLRPA